jgi:hypothetical protein
MADRLRHCGNRESHHLTDMWLLTPLLVALSAVQPPTLSVAKVGPIAVTESSVDSRGWVHYTIESDLRIDTPPYLVFWRFEIVRTYADGSRDVSVQEHDFFEATAISCLGGGSLWGSPGFLPSHITIHVQPSKNVGRVEVPVAVRVRPVTVLLFDGSAFGDTATLARLPARRQMLIRDLDYWSDRIDRTLGDFPGVVGLRLVAQELSTAHWRQETGLRMAWKSRFEELVPVAERDDAYLLAAVLRNLALSTQQFRDLATEQLERMEVGLSSDAAQRPAVPTNR